MVKLLLTADRPSPATDGDGCAVDQVPGHLLLVRMSLAGPADAGAQISAEKVTYPMNVVNVLDVCSGNGGVLSAEGVCSIDLNEVIGSVDCLRSLPDVTAS